MVSKLDSTFSYQNQALNLRAQRAQLLAANIANADTPHYKARDLDFGAALQGALAGQGAQALPLATSARGHLNGLLETAPTHLFYRKETQSAVDGNTVDMDVERAQFADNALRYEASLTFLNGQIRNMLDALQNVR